MYKILLSLTCQVGFKRSHFSFFYKSLIDAGHCFLRCINQSSTRIYL